MPLHVSSSILESQSLSIPSPSTAGVAKQLYKFSRDKLKFNCYNESDVHLLRWWIEGKQNEIIVEVNNNIYNKFLKNTI